MRPPLLPTSPSFYANAFQAMSRRQRHKLASTSPSNHSPYRPAYARGIRRCLSNEVPTPMPLRRRGIRPCSLRAKGAILRWRGASLKEGRTSKLPTTKDSGKRAGFRQCCCDSRNQRTVAFLVGINTVAHVSRKDMDGGGLLTISRSLISFTTQQWCRTLYD